jgi:hypothetical protein
VKYDEITPVMRKFLGGWLGFRKLGFSADDLYCAIYKSARNQGLLSCFVTLRTQGKEFNLEIGPIDDAAALEKEYARVCGAASQVSQADLERIWRESEIYERKSDFIFALMNKGFELPPASTFMN